MTATIVQTADPTAMVVLRGQPGRCSKTFTKNDDGTIAKTSYGNGFTWVPRGVRISNGLHGLLATLKVLSKRDDCIVVKEALRDDALADKPIERKSCAVHHEAGTLAAAPRHWVFIDIDSIPIPEVIRDLDYASKVSYITDQMPACFKGVSVVAQLTSSEGVESTDGSTMRVRLWYWCKKPVMREALRAALADCTFVCDLSIYNSAQPVYVCSPKFAGMPDPIAERFFIVPGHVAEEVDNTNWPDEPVARDDDDETERQIAAMYATVVPNQQEIGETVTRILAQRTKFSRHNHALAAIHELRIKRADRLTCALVAEDLFNRPKGNDPPRQPTNGEINGMIRTADKQILAGRAYTNNLPISSILDNADAAAAAVPPEKIVDGQQIVNSAPSAIFMMVDDYQAAVLYRQQVYPSGGLVRWQENDYEYNGRHWYRLENEGLKSRIQKITKLPSRKSASVRDSLRSLVHEEKLNPPCLISTGTPMPEKVVLENGILDVYRWLADPRVALEPPTADLFTFNVVPFNYDPAARCPVLHAFLNSVWPGDENADQRREFQKMLGYMLIGDNRYQKLFLIRGATRSGKGTIQSIIRMLVGGPNIGAPTLSSLAQPFGLAALEGKSVALIGEMNEQHAVRIDTLAVDRIKAIVGGDEIAINRKNRDEVYRKMPVKFVIACNRLPQFTDPSGAIQTRAVLFDMPISFAGREDTELGDKLMAEMPGILNFALAGLRILLTEDTRFMETNASKRLRTAFVNATAPVQAFAAEAIEVGKHGDTVIKEDMYEAYRAWLRREGYDHPMPRPRFVQEIEQMYSGIVTAARPLGHSGERPMGWHGIKFTRSGAALAFGHALDDSLGLLD
jgi:P4 family phage/plasmid primase-like protien